jgi:hypothetical protein
MSIAMCCVKAPVAPLTFALEFWRVNTERIGDSWCAVSESCVCNRSKRNEITVVHRRGERLEELGASNAGFAKEIDHLLTRVAEIEKRLKIDKKIAA